MLRTHTCGELRRSDETKSVTLSGWVNSYRDHGENLVFIDLRDRYGKTQIVFNTEEHSEIDSIARKLRREDVIQVVGEVRYRGDDLVNPKLDTGEIEVRVHELKVFSQSKTPPFEIDGNELPNEELRLKYRFVDLRRSPLQEAMKLRHDLTTAVRDYFNSNQFLEIETPILGRSTPEGARDYLVPSRVHHGAFYALPQSPQIYKQILMVSGFDRYYQIARCFRDEDLRADRQPEFTQIDVEMSFVERDDILEMIDGLVSHVVKSVQDIDLPTPLPRYTYADVMERYGSDKPDLRFGMELIDIGDVGAASEFGVFKSVVNNGGRVRGINAKGAADKYSRRLLDKDLKDFVGEYGAKGLAYMKVAGGKLESTIAKFFNEEQQQEIIKRMDGEDGDLLLFVADAAKVTSNALAALRNRMGKELELYDPAEFSALWVVDFPLLTWNEDEQRYDAEHHPFCEPNKQDLEYLKTDPSKVRADSYDLVINGYEAASGSVRIHDSGVQQTIFDLMNIKEEEAEARFGFLLEALRYGAPPHAGVALGLDRWVMLLAGNDNIRDVLAFPKTQRASDLLTGAPAGVDEHQLKDLHISVEDEGEE
ncbi:aspartate--tRNA ligase [Fuerstiella marisgermanici]|uniref:Aspartate--tRNA(Asp/Asn) ligase n=1 Tax=Fuerstiella marisgermanici TaxID=1891926 RepID=A0A1P8WS92_9PLAN|nr:aspartate--tRNA ligase [Fuerstiella marisgermanici]APZ96911.1 Aspartate--tRNA ligase [Fuerstiella marisgermanici]